MDVVSLNGWAIVAAVLSSFVVAWLWYSPALFARPWMEMSNVAKADFDAGLPKALFGDLFAFTAMALVLNQVLRSWGVTTLAHGLLVSCLIWLGFVASVLLSSVTYEHKPVRYAAINAGYRLVAMLIMGTILTLWR
jgi:hypothetical protein